MDRQLDGQKVVMWAQKLAAMMAARKGISLVVLKDRRKADTRVYQMERWLGTLWVAKLVAVLA